MNCKLIRISKAVVECSKVDPVVPAFVWRITTKPSVRIADIPPEVRTVNLLNASMQRYRHTRLLSLIFCIQRRSIERSNCIIEQPSARVILFLDQSSCHISFHAIKSYLAGKEVHKTFPHK
jgi:hypothetical protein